METDRQILELCKEWFENIMEKCDRLTTGNVSHNGRAIHGYAKNCAEFVESHLKDGSVDKNHWKPSDEQMEIIQYLCEHSSHPNPDVIPTLESLYNDLKKLKEK